MITIHKYEVPLDQPTHLQLPLQHVVVHVGSDFPGTATAWILHDLDEDKDQRRFRVVDTGYPIEPDEVHVGSFALGNRIAHLVAER
jgi:hypothetical protein